MKPLLLIAIAALASNCQESVSVKGKVGVPEEATKKKTKLKLRYAGQTGEGKKKEPSRSPAVVYLEGAPSSSAKDVTVEMKQEGLEFRPRILPILAGTKVKFTNDDDIYHNVLSYSDVKRFDLGRYPKGESKETTFDKKGLVDVYCEIHEHMKAFILVLDNPYFTTAGEDGSFEIKSVPPGKYTIVAWQEDYEPIKQEIEVKSGAAAVEMKFAKADAQTKSSDESVAGGSCCEKKESNLEPARKPRSGDE